MDEIVTNVSPETFVIALEGGGPWGFTLQGGAEFRSPLKIGKVTPGGKAQKSGLIGGDILLNINGVSTSTMKHHEAQRLIAASKTNLDLTCTKAVDKSPKSSITFRTFDYPPRSTTPVDNFGSKSSTLGRHARQSSLDLNTFRSRAWSDAGKKAVVGAHIAGIKVPAPPPSVKGKAPLPVVQPEKVRYVAGIKIPAPPPQLKPKPVRTPSKERIPAGTSTIVPLNDTAANDAPATTEPVTIGSSSSTPAVLESKEDPIVISDTLVKKEASAEVAERDTSSEIIDMLTAIQNDFTPTTPESQTSSSDFKDISSEKDHFETEYHSSTSGYKSGIASSSEEDILSTSAGSGSDWYRSDWYRSMFQSMKKGVEEQLPNKKHVCDRSPTPARKFKETNEDATSLRTASSSESNRRSSESNLASPKATSGQAMARTSSSGAVDAVNSLTSGVVYRRNMQNFNQSRNYWKSIERQASQERIELAAAAARRNSFHRTSSTSSTGRVASPDVPEASHEPVFNETLSEFKDSIKEEEKVDLPKSPSPAISPRVRTPEQPKTPPLITKTPPPVSPKPTNSPPLRSYSPLGRQTPPLGRSDSPLGRSTPPQTPPLRPITPPQKSPTSPLKPLTPPPVKPRSPSLKSPTSPQQAQSFGSPPADVSNFDEAMSKLHPLLKDSVDPPDGGEVEGGDNSDASQQNLFSRIDPSKLNTALGNAAILGKMEQEGVKGSALQSAALAVGQASQEEKKPVPQKKKTKTTKPPPAEKAKALYDFEAASPKEMSFKKGDVISLTEQVDSNWLKGTVNGQTGIFPVNFVKLLTQDDILLLDSQIDPVEPPPLNLLAKAKYNFTAKSSKELSFNKNDVITLVKQVDENWYEGCLGDEKGIVPVTFVQIFDVQEDN
ncbi:PREDICTED: LIM domain-binding protein 3-like [Amphimedon queenslandica]|uniref:Uncharacterized protein n=1 Tax=Amphimedon queenslandica TaxID=400682 RepID=A0A1X7VVV7_AMPQE|nr:PREDICTED: LIM domain-binding protein 3-like [Amphimedon queenslandica]|eukprot:XP_019848782.1 PREDICTED: LIM domain-binding protein 3-like [Amphimedon queenslandica]